MYSYGIVGELTYNTGLLVKIPKRNRHACTFLISLLSTIYCIFEVVSLGIVGHKRHICVTGVRKKRKEKKMRSQDTSFLSIIVLVALVAKNNNDDNNKYIRFLA